MRWLGRKSWRILVLPENVGELLTIIKNHANLETFRDHSESSTTFTPQDWLSGTSDPYVKCTVSGKACLAGSCARMFRDIRLFRSFEEGMHEVSSTYAFRARYTMLQAHPPCGLATDKNHTFAVLLPPNPWTPFLSPTLQC